LNDSSIDDATNVHPDEYTALQKYISTYRDPKAHAAEDAEANAADAGKGKAWWQFWRSGNSGASTAADPGFVPEEMLEADIKQGISSHEVETRRKRYGWNEITTEKENLFIKFLGFFTGPVLYGKSTLPISGNAPGRVSSLSPNGSVAFVVCFAFASFDRDTEL
jgi:magnesium-transporting ATPase (P-type)